LRAPGSGATRTAAPTQRPTGSECGAVARRDGGRGSGVRDRRGRCSASSFLSGRGDRLHATYSLPVARHIALLRGVNIGPNKRVDMPRLRELLTGLGYGDVRTYVQSGNIILTSRKSPRRMERDLRKEVATGLGVDTEVIVRTRDELAGVIERDPLGTLATNPKRYQVSFLSGEPGPEVARKLAAVAAPPEQAVI